jgi:hypothetical protein
MANPHRRGHECRIRYSRRAVLKRALLTTAGLAAFGPPAGAKEQAPTSADDAGKTLGDLLTTLAWDPASRGPLLVVGAETTRRLIADDGTPQIALPEPSPDGRRNLSRTLPAFGRQLFPFGTLTVAAPSEMVEIADDPARGPHVWDTLDNNARSLVFFSRLSGDQWAKLASARGIGLGDLTSNDQKDLFDSLLPNPFGTQTYRINTTGRTALGSQTLTDDDRSGVRLRVQLSLKVEVPLLDRARSFAGFFDTAETDDVPGAVITRVGDVPPLDLVSHRNAILRRTVPNRSKPSDLPYDDPRLAYPVALREGETVNDLVQRIAARCGVEMYSDYRVAPLTVSVRGEQANAGGLLQALAIAVTGAWRHVQGDCYVLASDLVGAGSRFLQLAEQAADQSEEANRLQNEAADFIAKAGYFKKYAAFPPDDPLAPPPELMATISSVEGTGALYDTENFRTIAAMPQAFQDYYRREFASAGRQAANWDSQHFIAERHLFARFVLPDGSTASAGDICPAWMFRGDLSALGANIESDMLNAAAGVTDPYPLAPHAQSRSLFVAPSNAEEGRAAVDAARRYGFDALRIVSDDVAVVRAAVEETHLASAPTPRLPAGRLVTVWAVICPFAAPPDAAPGDIDCNLLGETSDVVLTRRQDSPSFTEYFTLLRCNGALELTPEWVTEPGIRSVIPSDAGSNAVRAMAAIGGLTGILISCPAPPGYRPPLKTSYALGKQAEIRAALGYAPALRLAFLRAEGMDPIDLTPDSLDFNGDMSTPFFPGDNSRSDSGQHLDYSAKRQRWSAFRQTLDRRALGAIYGSVRERRPDVALYIAAQPQLVYGMEQICLINPVYVPWTASADAPVWSEALGDLPGAINPCRFAYPESKATGLWLGCTLKALAEAPKPGPTNGGSATAPGRTDASARLQRFDLDLSGMPFADAEKILARWVKPANG